MLEFINDGIRFANHTRDYCVGKLIQYLPASGICRNFHMLAQLNTWPGSGVFLGIFAFRRGVDANCVSVPSPQIFGCGFFYMSVSTCCSHPTPTPQYLHLPAATFFIHHHTACYSFTVKAHSLVYASSYV